MPKARILVVDDEPSVLHLVAKMLQRGGYETVTALGPLQALEIITTLDGLDAIVSDVVMPGMCGRRVSTTLRHLA